MPAPDRSSMNRTVYALCALCAIAGICEQMTSDGAFTVPMKMLVGLEVALSVLEIARKVWTAAVRWLP